jgi:NHL repeat
MKKHRVRRLRFWLVGTAAVAAIVATGAFGVSGGGTITTIAGTGKFGVWAGLSGDGVPATKARLGFPAGVAVDGKGNVYIADKDTYRVRKVDRDGTITTIAGTGRRGFSGDGGSATSATLTEPVGVAVDEQGTVYIADPDSARVRKVNPGGTITTFAGNGRGFLPLGDGGPATSAQLNDPVGVAVDRKGNVYIADDGNNRVRRVSPGGTITTIAGNGTCDSSGKRLGDGGPATSAQLCGPAGIAVDEQGNVYIADGILNMRVRKVNPGGTITTFAGNGKCSDPGGGARTAELCDPVGVAVDGNGNVYIADNGDNRVRKVSPRGTMTAFAGTGETCHLGEPCTLGDGGPATSAKLVPTGVAVDAKGNVYIADGGNRRVRKVTVGGRSPAAGPVTGSATGTVLVNGRPYTGGPIPYGSKVDVTKGKVTLRGNVGTLTVSGDGQITAQFILLRFKAGGKPIVELRMTGGDFGICKSSLRTSSRLGAKKPPKVVRRLFTKGKGSFRTRGRFASATVRGTNWQTGDRCDGTFEKTRQGVVAVFDLVLKKTVLVKAGQSYLAKKP